MKKLALYATAVLMSVALTAWVGQGKSAFGVDADSIAEKQTKTVVNATTAFLKTLTKKQRQTAQFSFTAEKKSKPAVFQAPGGKGPAGGFVGEQYGQAIWSNFPNGDVPRPGLRMADMSAAQREALMHILQVALSNKGYQKVLEIMGSDQVHHDTVHPPYCAGIDCYTVGIFGTPSATSPWMLEFGGHHLGLNLTMQGELGVITPTLTGAQPAVYTSEGKTVRVLAAENDKAFDLINVFDLDQRKTAILNYRVADLVLAPGHQGDKLVPEGLKASAMNERQRAMLLDLISQWAGIVNDAYAAPRMAQIKAGLNDTYFAWSGPTTHEPGNNGRSYYRIQGPRVVIEFSPQDTQGDSMLHVHTIYRDPLNDYGAAFTNP
jgi:Protein of unknown function (DUF3500)